MMGPFGIEAGMKLESMFHQLLGLGAEWEVTGLAVREADGTVEIAIAETEALWTTARCPEDGSGLFGYDHGKERRWRHLNIFEYRCEIVCRLPRGKCGKCGKVTTIRAPWEGLTKHFTLAFESMALLLMRESPVKTVAAFVGEHDTRLWRMLDRHVEKAREEKQMGEVDAVCCDELAIRKGRVYASVFADARKREVLFSTETKEEATWERFAADLREHGGDPAKILWGSIDMSKSYQAGARKNAPNAKLVFDKFHVIKMANDAVDEVRRKEMKSVPDDAAVMKKQRYVFLKNPGNLTEKQARSLDDLTKLNLQTAKAYQMRLALQEIYRSKGSVRARRRLEKWVSWTKRAARVNKLLAPMKRVGQTILKHLDGVLGYWESDRLTNAFMEGLMSVFSATKRKARGYRTFSNLKTMLYFTASNLNIPFQPLFHAK
jgi:transposase